MQIKRILLICVPVASIVFLGIYRGFQLHEHLIVHARQEDVAAQFTDLDKWKSWHKELVDTDKDITVTTKNRVQEIVVAGASYRIEKIYPALVVFTRQQGNKTSSGSLSVMPYGDGSYSWLEYAETVSGFGWLKKQLSGRDEDMHMLLNLQSFMEDDSRRYGFLIKQVPVSDTLILTTRMKAATDSNIQYIAVLHRRLENYCRRHAVIPVGNYYYVSVLPSGNNEVELAAGYPVKKEAEREPGFEFLKLPARGRLIVGRYNGRYADRQQLYNAMNRYMLDKRLKKAAQPLELYGNADTLFTQAGTISMQLFYPVF